MTEDLEQRIRTDLQGEATSLRAPNDLWSRVRSEIDAAPHPRPLLRARWLATAGLALAGAAALLVLTVVVPRLGGDEPLDAGSILARAAEAAEDPSSVGLESYRGHVEVTAAYHEGDPQPTSMDISFEAPNRFRIETNVGLTVVSNGETIWTYDASTKSYQAMPYETLERASAPGVFELLILPAFLDFEEIRAELRDDPEGGVTVIGDEAVLGRDAYLVIDRSGEPQEARIWLDKRYLLPLHVTVNDASSPGEIFNLAYTSIEFDVPLDDELFEFTPPPGARRVKETETEAEDTEVLEIGATQEAP